MKDEDECECCESTAVIRDDSDVESWRIEEQELDVQIAVRVKGGAAYRRARGLEMG